MAVKLKKRLVNVEEYHLMAQAGILTAEDRVELIQGEIIQMSPIGSRHALCVNKLNAILNTYINSPDFISVQNPIQLSELSEPEPDIAVIHGPMERFVDHHPRPEDVHLIIEVAETTLDTDREIKLPLYAEAGIPVIWIINLKDKEVEVHTNPDKKSYLERKIFRKDAQLPLPHLDTNITVSDIISQG